MLFIRKNWMLLAGGILIGAGVGLAVLTAFGIGGPFVSQFGVTMDGKPYLAPEGDSPAPSFELQDLAGERVSLSGLKGRPVVVNFWATWCGPCRTEMPVLEEHFAENGGDLVILGVNVGEPADKVGEYVEELGLTFPILLDTESEVYSLYRVRGMPTTFFVDAEGIVRYQHIGSLSETQLVNYLEKIGAGP